ncbi:MAG: 4-hydroxy-tetrahydrodipicolinate reductase [Candidatus Meridianibacter frigidus]|nr:MAG: 4-hydroxy-tetrahydrodipicolinate reductase [Candidatus Eremiobacteraeota bacterium]
MAVAGIHGKMGTMAAQVIRDAEDLELVGGFARERDAGNAVFSDFAQMLQQTEPDVVVDFTTHPVTVELARECVEHAVSPVIGSSAWTNAETKDLRALAEKHGVGAMLVPNFALGAVLMMRFAEQAAKIFSSVEIIEMHHERKKDKPSGTARATAERLRPFVAKDVAIHSLRLQGVLAHQEVIFGGPGERLSIQHNSLSRDSFAAGLLFAVRNVRKQKDFTVGLDSLVDGLLR